MTHPYRILLINGASDDHWHTLVERIAETYGALTIGSAATAPALLAEGRYAVIIIDASVVEQVPQLIRRIHTQQPYARIVVATASPSWQGARAAFLAGAFDYTVKSLCYDDLAGVVAAAIDAPPPPCR